MTDRRRLSGSGASPGDVTRCLLAQTQQAVDAGIDVIQVRERDLEGRDLYRLVRSVIEIAAGSRTRVVVNERLDVAIAAGADGVHLRGDSIAAAAARRIAPSGFLIGRSVHDVSDAVANVDGADYLIAGTIWSTPSKPKGRALLGIDGLARVTAAVSIPVLAIGGISLERMSQVAQAHAAGAAGIGLFMTTATDTENRCRATGLEAVAREARRFQSDA